MWHLVATTIAIQEMVDFLASDKKLSKHAAYQLVSVAGHVAERVLGAGCLVLSAGA